MAKKKNNATDKKFLSMNVLENPNERNRRSDEQYVCPGCNRSIHPLPPCPYCMTPAQVHIFPKKWRKFVAFLSKSPKNYVKLWIPEGKAINFEFIDEKAQKKQLREKLNDN